MVKLGAHMSIAGSVVNALSRGASVECETIQIFVKNNNRWQGKELAEEICVEFLQKKRAGAIDPVFAHNCYLINLASPDDELYERSIRAMIDEVERCHRLDLPYLVMHPGAHMGSGEEAGIRRIATALDRIFRDTRGMDVALLLETTAGQGTSLGHTFGQLAAVMDRVDSRDRLGVCLDTCHVFAAGYDICTRNGYRQTMAEFDEMIGLSRLKALHLNDSKKPLGSRVDRHAHIGQGALGVEPFAYFLRDKRLAGLPAVIETPKNEQLDEDRINLGILRRLRSGVETGDEG